MPVAFFVNGKFSANRGFRGTGTFRIIDNFRHVVFHFNAFCRISEIIQDFEKIVGCQKGRNVDVINVSRGPCSISSMTCAF